MKGDIVRNDFHLTISWYSEISGFKNHKINVKLVC